MRPSGLIFFFATALAPVGVKAQETQIAGAVAQAIYQGKPIANVEGIAGLEPEIESKLESLAGCVPSVASGSSRQFVGLNFACERSGELPVAREVTLRFNGKEMEGISVSDWRAVGPTPRALRANDLPSKSSQLKSVQQAVLRGEDVSLGGLLPLTPEQVGSLEDLSSCKWKALTNTPSVSRSALVRCPDKERMVILYFDELKRVTSVEIEQGFTVRRPAL